MIQEIHTNDAPGAVGPFSQAIKVGDLLFLRRLLLQAVPRTGLLRSQRAS